MGEEELAAIKYAAAPTFKDIQALVAEVERLREVERIAYDALSRIARCGCSACGPALSSLREARVLADDAMTQMSVVE